MPMTMQFSTAPECPIYHKELCAYAQRLVLVYRPALDRIANHLKQYSYILNRLIFKLS